MGFICVLFSKEIPPAPKPVEKKSTPVSTSTVPVQSAPAATQTQPKVAAPAPKAETTAQKASEEKELDWKKHVKEFDLQEEATVNGEFF